MGTLTMNAYLALGDRSLSSEYIEELGDVASRAGHSTVLVAVRGDEVLGAVTYVRGSTTYSEFVDDEAGIRHLAVAPVAQRRGVGAALVTACVERAREEGASSVRLYTTPAMTTAHRIYERLGFRRAPERDWSPEPQVPLLSYVLRLDR